jgi:hypothetical protein
VTLKRISSAKKGETKKAKKGQKGQKAKKGETYQSVKLFVDVGTDDAKK